jgi:5-methylcytosine-specific restriction endonuclease McrA
MSSEIETHVARLIRSLNPGKLLPHREKVAQIKRYYHPRARFNRWRDSDEGRRWKQQQYDQLTDRKCPGCEQQLPSIEHFQIDHIRPICLQPDLAVDLKNLRLLCSPCNLRATKGKQSNVDKWRVRDSQRNR